jgi:hypothetical protein
MQRLHVYSTYIGSRFYHIWAAFLTVVSSRDIYVYIRILFNTLQDMRYIQEVIRCLIEIMGNIGRHWGFSELVYYTTRPYGFYLETASLLYLSSNMV